MVAEGTVAASQQGKGHIMKMQPSEALARGRLTSGVTEVTTFISKAPGSSPALKGEAGSL